LVAAAGVESSGIERGREAAAQDPTPSLSTQQSKKTLTQARRKRWTPDDSPRRQRQGELAEEQPRGGGHHPGHQREALGGAHKVLGQRCQQLRVPRAAPAGDVEGVAEVGVNDEQLLRCWWWWCCCQKLPGSWCKKLLGRWCQKLLGSWVGGAAGVGGGAAGVGLGRAVGGRGGRVCDGGSRLRGAWVSATRAGTTRMVCACTQECSYFPQQRLNHHSTSAPAAPPQPPPPAHPAPAAGRTTRNECRRDRRYDLGCLGPRLVRSCTW